MRPVVLPLLLVDLRQLGRVQNQKVFGIACFRSIGEIETTRDHHSFVNQHQFVVRNGVATIASQEHLCLFEQHQHIVVLGLAFLINQHPHLDPALLGTDQGFGNRPMCEAISLNQNLALALVNLRDDGLGHTRRWCEVNTLHLCLHGLHQSILSASQRHACDGTKPPQHGITAQHSENARHDLNGLRATLSNTQQKLPASVKKAILFLSLATFSSMAVQRICDPMLPELSRSFDVAIGDAAQVISLFALTYGLMQLFYGPVGDRFGKYRVVMWAALGSSVGCVLCVLSPDLNLLIAARVATALAAAAIIPLSLAWIGDVVHYQQRQETLARLGLGTTLGMTAGQLFGGIFTDTLGWRSAFVLMALMFALVCVLLWRQLRQIPPPPVAHEDSGFFKQLRQVSHDGWARTLLLIALIEGATIFGVLAITASHLHHNLGISLTLAGGATALYGLGGMAYMASAKLAIRRFGEVGLARYGGLSFACAFGVIAFTPWWWLAIPACFVGVFGFAMFHNTMQAKATQMVPTARATGVTLFAGFLFLGQSIGVLILASLISHFASTWVIAADAAVVVLLGWKFSQAIEQRNATEADHA